MIHCMGVLGVGRSRFQGGECDSPLALMGHLHAVRVGNANGPILSPIRGEEERHGAMS